MRHELGHAALAIALVVCGCAGPSASHKLELNRRIASKDWANAAAHIEAAKDREYGDKNSVLYWLDLAAVLHDARRYAESDDCLDKAERRMDELYTQSLTRAGLTFLVNDNADVYEGQLHERTLLHLLRGLNYAYQGKRDEAAVEARKVSAFLAEVSDRAGDAHLTYRDDAFAHYLSGLLFEDQGRFDDARISIRASRSAYEWYATEFGVPQPHLDPGVGSPGDGELVVLHYNGLAPRRETATLQVAWDNAIALVHASEEGTENVQVKNAIVAGLSGNAITVALPTFVQDSFLIQSSEIRVGDVAAPTVLMQDVAAIARHNLEEKLPALQAKAVVRATIKFVLAKVVEAEAKQRLGNAAGFLVGIAGRSVAAGTEVADTRCWSTLPAQFRMARLRLPPGTHDVKVRYFAADGSVVTEELLEAVTVSAGLRTYVHVRTAI